MFIGIPIEEAARAKLSRTVAQLSLPDSDFRRSRPQDWHITLQFLGNVTPERFECLLPRLANISAPPARVQIVELGFFGDRILAAGVQPTPVLRSLADKVVAATHACGFHPESRLWRPHITLARAKGRPNRASIARVRGQIEKIDTSGLECGFLAAEFRLYQSFTGAPGSRYETRGQFPLRDSA